MTLESLNGKYSNFLAPNFQININDENIKQTLGIIPTAISVQKMTKTPDTFSFLIDDPKQKWTNSEIFDLNNKVEIKLGYATTLQTITSAEITAIKTLFQPSQSPQIQIFGENKTSKKESHRFSSQPIATLEYGKSLLSFIAETASASLHCSGESIGLPEILPGTKVSLLGLGAKFNKNYLVEKAIHSFGNQGYKTTFEGKEDL